MKSELMRSGGSYLPERLGRDQNDEEDIRLVATMFGTA